MAASSVLYLGGGRTIGSRICKNSRWQPVHNSTAIARDSSPVVLTNRGGDLLHSAQTARDSSPVVWTNRGGELLHSAQTARDSSPVVEGWGGVWLHSAQIARDSSPVREGWGGEFCCTQVLSSHARLKAFVILTKIYCTQHELLVTADLLGKGGGRVLLHSVVEEPCQAGDLSNPN